jgi:hypothetical protein
MYTFCVEVSARGSGSTTLSLVPAERCDDDDSATAAVRAQMQVF